MFEDVLQMQIIEPQTLLSNTIVLRYKYILFLNIIKMKTDLKGELNVSCYQ